MAKKDQPKAADTSPAAAPDTSAPADQDGESGTAQAPELAEPKAIDAAPVAATLLAVVGPHAEELQCRGQFAAHGALQDVLVAAGHLKQKLSAALPLAGDEIRGLLARLHSAI